MSLADLGKRHGTDKFSHRYLPYYERHIRGEVTSLLEIGVLEGNSLRMWRDHFPNAQIWGLDIDPRCKAQESERIRVVTGSQDDPDVLNDLADRAGGFDVVIDDGSHVNTHMLASWRYLWPHTRSVYAIEDLTNTYLDLTPHVDGWPGMQHNQAVDYRNDRALMDRFFAARIAEVDNRDQSSIHFYPGLVVMVR